jgi:hypothetical protein
MTLFLSVLPRSIEFFFNFCPSSIREPVQNLNSFPFIFFCFYLFFIFRFAFGLAGAHAGPVRCYVISLTAAERAVSMVNEHGSKRAEGPTTDPGDGDAARLPRAR